MSKNIDQLYKDKFEQFEAPVPDNLWDKINRNPKWRLHLRRQKIKNLAIYAGLATIAISTCVALLLHQPNDERQVAEDKYQVSEEEYQGTNDMEQTTSVREPIAETTSEPACQPGENTESIAEVADTRDASVVENTSENSSSPNTNSDSNTESVVSSSDNTTPVKAEPTMEKTNSTNKTISPSETNSTKHDDRKNAEPISNPGTDESEDANHSLFSIPNAFTPNGDGLNDVFKPVTSAEIISYQLDIFMLNGQHIFSSKNIDYGWNGEYQGSLSNGGTYIYVVKYKGIDGKEHIDKGQLLLIR